MAWAIPARAQALPPGAPPSLPPPPVGAAPAAPAVPDPSVPKPKIVFANPVYDFGKLSGGASAKCDYVFTNIGTAALEVTDVRPSCGCTVAGEWSKRVEPGRSGMISVVFNSGNFSGAIHKTVSVTCNDPAQNIVMLQLKGTVWKPVDVNPTYAIFNPTIDSTNSETRSVRIVNNTDESMTLQPPESTNPSFKAEVKTIREGKEFEVIVTAIPPFTAGTIQSGITVKTSSTNMPVISVNALVMAQQAVMVMPSQIMLPPPPLPPNTKMGVTIRNNSATTNMALSEPSVNAPGVDVQIQELQVGRVFNVLLGFPAGFEIQQGQRLELALKSSHPQHPVVKVPIFQAPKPAQPFVPPQQIVRTNAFVPRPPATVIQPRPVGPPNPPPLPPVPASRAK